jgi:ESCRT-I complex subunit VPS37
MPRSTHLTPAPPLVYLPLLLGPFPRRDDLHDLLTDEQYHQAFVATLPAVKAKVDEIDAIERTNEELAETNLALQPQLAQLRSETLAAFTHAHELKAKWAEVEKEQASLYQVRSAIK